MKTNADHGESSTINLRKFPSKKIVNEIIKEGKKLSEITRRKMKESNIKYMDTDSVILK